MLLTRKVSADLTKITGQYLPFRCGNRDQCVISLQMATNTINDYKKTFL